jgi:hypothetical protein
MQRVFSIGQISRELGAEPHRIRYAIESRGVQSIGKVGGTNAYDEGAVEQIRKALDATSGGRWGRGEGGNAASEAAAVPAGT